MGKLRQTLWWLASLESRRVGEQLLQLLLQRLPRPVAELPAAVVLAVEPVAGLVAERLQLLPAAVPVAVLVAAPAAGPVVVAAGVRRWYGR